MITLWMAAYATEISLSYDACLREAVLHNARVQRAHLDVQAASVGVRSSLGFLDPVAGFDANWRNSKSRGFFQGFPFTSSSKTWDLGASISGTSPTGTSYALNAGVNRNFSSFVTDFGVGGTNEQIQDAYTSNFNVSLTQELLKGFKIGYNLQNVTRSKQAVTAAELRETEAVQETLAETARAYWAWSYQVQLTAIAVEAVTTATEALRVAELKLEAGQIAPLERTRLKAAAVQAEVNQMDARLAAEQALDALLALQGQETLEPDAYRPTTQPMQGALSTIERASAVEVAMASNPSLLLARAALDDAGVNLSNSRHARLPTLSATASAGIGAQDTNAGKALGGVFDQDAFPFLQVGASFRMPLGNRAARGQAASAGVDQQRAQVDLEDLERTVRAAVVRQVQTVNAGALRVQLAVSNQALAQESLAAEEALLAAGRSIQTNLLNARSEATRTATEVVKARTDHQLALLELQRLQGGIELP